MNSIHRNFSSLTDYLTLHLQNSHLNPKQLLQIQTQIITNGYLHTSPIPNLLKDFLSSCFQFRNFNYALLFLQNLHKPSTSLWNSIIRASVEAGFNHNGLGYYNVMLCENVLPDASTIAMLLRGAASVSGNKLGDAFHCHIVKLGFEFNLFLQTGLLNFYAKVGNLESAKKVFVEMPEKDSIVHNVMISALGKQGHVNDARKLFDEMPERSSFSWNSMISCYCRLGDIENERSIFDCNPLKDVITWNTMIDGYCKLS